jgi:hypothetical protein
VQQVLVLVVVLDARTVDGDPAVGRANAPHVLGEEVKSAPRALTVCRAASGLGEGVGRTQNTVGGVQERPKRNHDPRQLPRRRRGTYGRAAPRTARSLACS